ncbi:hypothetical protein HMPREF1562_1833 [Providencia alcalifaciens F90-2004]|nr:hypothetical protein HMPREF1562_1833 [Providencia alcalifaciens F90-2004]
MFAGSMVLLAASYFIWQSERMAGWTRVVGVSTFEKHFLRKVSNE